MRAAESVLQLYGPGEDVHLEALQGDEHWWGGAIVHGYRMPFVDGYRDDLAQVGENQAMPVLLSSRGRYVWSDEPFAFEVRDGALSIHPHGDGAVEVGQGLHTLRGGYLAALHHFPATGERPPAELFTAPQYNLWIETLFRPTQDTVVRYAELALEHAFPPGVLMVDDLWHEAYGDWTFHSGRFPDPRGMVDRLHDLGFAVMLWVVPLVTTDTPTFRALRARGLLLSDAAGEPIVGKWWNGYSAALDLLNPQALSWLETELAKLQAQFGVDGFKFDAGDTSFYAAVGVEKPERYTMAWNEFGTLFPLNEFRAAWKAAGLPLVQRQRDKHHSWDEKDGLGSLIANGLAQGLTGHAFTCPDMVGGGDYQAFPMTGGSGDFDAELFVRSAQCQALFPMMQFSAAPWRVLDDEHLELCARAAQLHVEHGAEILRLADMAASTGEPIQRHLAYVFPHQGYETITDQFMLGDDLLVAPVIHKGERQRKVAIPPGSWIADDGIEYTGPTTVDVYAPLDRLPRFRRVGASASTGETSLTV
jgi:alpha-glucosidase (family GH31 glycosyl hydrolase)